jgi:hypothetical protein
MECDGYFVIPNNSKIKIDIRNIINFNLSPGTCYAREDRLAMSADRNEVHCYPHIIYVIEYHMNIRVNIQKFIMRSYKSLSEAIFDNYD